MTPTEIEKLKQEIEEGKLDYHLALRHWARCTDPDSYDIQQVAEKRLIKINKLAKVK
jgi:hypothetical protein